MSVSKKILVAIAGAVTLPVIASTSVLGYATQQFTPEANKAAYWGSTCVKYDNVKTSTYTAPAGAKKVIIKGGTLNAIYTSGSFTNLTAATNPNNGKPYGISHVIVCMGETTAPVKPVTPVTPVSPTKPVDDGKKKDDTPDKPHNQGGKEDKNQSACNPSDYRSANEKHRDDGVNCKDNKVTKNDNDVKGTNETGKIDAKAWSVTKTSTAKDDLGTPSEIPSTGVAVPGFVTALVAGLVAYGAMLRRKA